MLINLGVDIAFEVEEDMVVFLLDMPLDSGYGNPSNTSASSSSTARPSISISSSDLPL